MTRRLYRLWPLALLLLLLAGCSSRTAASHPIDPANSFWDHWFVGPLSHVLDLFAKYLGGQYGLSILVVTIIVRLIILPLTLKQYRSSKAMQALQPEMKKLKEKYKDDPKKQQEETMKLFQQHGVNPLAGCFPLLVQMPVLIALYNAIMRNPNISQHSFLWMKLGEPDHIYLLPLLAATTTFLQQKVMMATQQSNNQMPQMKMLLYIMPVLIFVMSMNFPSALPLYWVFTNTFTIVQTYLIYRPSKK